VTVPHLLSPPSGWCRDAPALLRRGAAVVRRRYPAARGRARDPGQRWASDVAPATTTLAHAPGCDPRRHLRRSRGSVGAAERATARSRAARHAHATGPQPAAPLAVSAPSLASAPTQPLATGSSRRPPRGPAARRRPQRPRSPAAPARHLSLATGSRLAHDPGVRARRGPGALLALAGAPNAARGPSRQARRRQYLGALRGVCRDAPREAHGRGAGERGGRGRARHPQRIPRRISPSSSRSRYPAARSPVGSPSCRRSKRS
jgi:hypothetical protein